MHKLENHNSFAARRIRRVACGRIVLLVCAVFAAPATALGQQLALTSRGPYYVDEPIGIQVNFTTNVVGNVDAVWEPPSGAPIEIRGPNRTGRQMSFNGRTSAVTNTLGFDLYIFEEGEFEIGPFVIELDGKKYETNTLTVTTESLGDDEDLILDLEAEFTGVYVGEKLPCKLTWGVRGGRSDVQFAYNRLRLRADFLEQFDVVSAEGASETPLRIRVGSQELSLPARATESMIGGEPVIVLESVFEVVPKRVLSMPEASLQCSTRKLVAVRRSGFFGQEVEDMPSRLSTAIGNIEILPIPTKGRPASFSGAVGTEFSLDVTASRSTVQVGDPLEVTFRLSGDGHLERLSLPNLAATKDFPEDSFQLPSQLPTGKMVNEARQFDMTIRAAASDVSEFPPIEFSWFNPATATFETTLSKAIPLEVREAQRITAGSVISGGTPAKQSEGSENAGPGGPTRMQTALAANLALPTATQLLRPTPLIAPNWALVACYVLPILLLPLAGVMRRIVSSRGKQTAVQFDDLLRRLSSLNNKSRAEQCEMMSAVIQDANARLSSLGAQADAFRGHASRISGELDAIRFAPEGSDIGSANGDVNLRAELSSLADDLRELLRSTHKELT